MPPTHVKNEKGYSFMIRYKTKFARLSSSHKTTFTKEYKTLEQGISHGGIPFPHHQMLLQDELNRRWRIYAS